MEDWQYKPAGDAGLRPSEQWQSLRREGGLPSALAHRAWCAVTGGYLKLCHRFRVVGREHLPPRPPFVVVANHASHLDALALAVGLPGGLREFAFPIAAGDTFFVTKATSAFAAIFLNALPMWRKKCGSHAMEALRERLIDGRAIYLLFPEGTRTRDGAMAEFRSGIGMIVAGTDIPVVPAYLDGCHAVMPPGARLPKRGAISLRFGPPLSFPRAGNDRAGWREISRRLEAAVQALATRR